MSKTILLTFLYTKALSSFRLPAPGLQVGAELLRDLGLQWPGKKG